MDDKPHISKADIMLDEMLSLAKKNMSKRTKKTITGTFNNYPVDITIITEDLPEE